MENDSSNVPSVPKFLPDVPGPMRDKSSAHEIYIYEQLSIQRQQNEWMMNRLVQGETRFREIESKQWKMSETIKSLEQFKTILTSKWSVLAFIASVIIGPLGMLIAGAAISKWMQTHWK
ncbi:MAG: hypothetical protein ACTHKU_07810 [Verrucomicrobiota bacterium]